MTLQTTQTTCPYCGVGCGVLATPQIDGSVEIKGDPHHPANFGRLCSKGSALGETLDMENRLLSPTIAGEQVSWDKALDTISNKFSEIIKEHGPDAIAFYVSGQIMTEDYYVANKLMKGFIGSGNIDTNSRLCMSSAVAAHKRAFGSDSVPCSYEDLEIADLVVLVGSNLAWCHPVIYQRLSQAKAERPDMKVVVIDPRRTATCEIADSHLSLKPGSDGILFNGLLHYLKQQDKLDWEFLEQHTEGFAAALAAAKASSPSIPEVARQCGLTESDVADFFRLFANTHKTVTLFSQGVNQSSSGTDKGNSIINCHIATGRIGAPGMGPFSMTGQPNAMGGREVGGLSNQLAAHMELDNPEHHDRVARFWNSPLLATKAGTKTIDMFQQIGAGKIKAVWIIATNPVVSLPEADKVREALAGCDLVIVSDCEQSSDTLALADITLPALAWGEKEGIVTNSERRLSHQRAFLPEPGEAKADWWMLKEVGKRMGFKDAFDFNCAADVFREHVALSAFENNGQRDFDLSALLGISDAQYQGLQPIQWPVNEAAPTGTARLFTDKQFNTPSGKARMIAIEPRLPANPVSVAYPLIMNNGRIRDQWHTQTRTGRATRLNGHINEPIIEIHPVDAARFQLKNGSLAKVSSALSDLTGRIVISDAQQEGSIFVPIHWHSQLASQGKVGALVAAVMDPLSGQPECKHMPVAIRPFEAKWHGFILSRTSLTLPRSDYWVKIRGEKFWRYELAGDDDSHPLLDWLKDATQADDDSEWLEFSDNAAGRYRAARILNDQLQTVVFVAADHHLPDRAWLSQLFTAGQLSAQQRMSLLVGKPGKGQPDAGQLVCACFGVGEKTICQAIKQQRLTSVDMIGEQLKAGTNCGSCVPELKKLLDATAH